MTAKFRAGTALDVAQIATLGVVSATEIGSPKHDHLPTSGPFVRRDTIPFVTSALEFRLVPVGDNVSALVPAIDGESLIDLVAAFESRRGYEPSGGYAGIIPAHFNFGDLTRYYEARADRQWPKPQHAWVLVAIAAKLAAGH